MAIINSLLDTDLYKFTMQHVVFKKFPDVEVEYKFKNRTRGLPLKHANHAGNLTGEINNICKMRFKKSELNYLKSLGFFSKGYINYLKRFKFNYDDVIVGEDKKGNLDIKVKGTWLDTILWEVPLLALISELNTNICMDDREKNFESIQYGRLVLGEKVKKLKMYPNISIADFGTRRRYSHQWQDYVVGFMKNNVRGFVGTSNVELARKHNVRPIGTMAHEFIQACQAFVRLSDSQKYAFQTWADVYRGNLGIALSDTLGMDSFFNDFDMYFSKLFDGARQDSGDPYKWCDKLIDHYEEMRIDTLTKTAVFSDGLNVDKIIKLYKTYGNRINVSFGIGTNLMNDLRVKPLQIVIKMTKCDGKPVAKISDSKGKQMCEDKDYLKYLATQFNIPKEIL